MRFRFDFASIRDESKPFLEHLEDLRQTILRCIAVLTGGMVLAFPFARQILAFLKVPLERAGQEPEEFLRTIEVTGAFMTAMRVAFWSGVIVSAPFLIFFIGSFVFPGLTARERDVVVKASGAAAVLFLVGVAMGYFVTLPVALQVMLKTNRWLGITAEWTINSYVAFSSQLLLGFGLTFEMPVLILILGRLGIFNSDQLREKRRHVIVGLLVVAMILTPPDVISQLIMGIPLILLYEACIWILRAWERSEAREAQS